MNVKQKSNESLSLDMNGDELFALDGSVNIGYFEAEEHSRFRHSIDADPSTAYALVEKLSNQTRSFLWPPGSEPRDGEPRPGWEDERVELELSVDELRLGIELSRVGFETVPGWEYQTITGSEKERARRLIRELEGILESCTSSSSQASGSEG